MLRSANSVPKAIESEPGVPVPVNRRSLITSWARTCDVLTRDAHPAVGAKASMKAIETITGGRCRLAVEDRSKPVSLTVADVCVGRTHVKVFDWASYTGCVTQTWRPRGHHLSIHIPLSGSFEVKDKEEWRAIRPGAAVIVSATGEICRRWTGPCTDLHIVVDRLAVDQCIATSDEASSLLETAKLTIFEFERHPVLAKYLDMMMSDLTAAAPSLSDPLIVNDFERLLLRLLLQPIRETYNNLPVGQRSAIAPHYVRSAEKYIRERFREAVTLESIVASSGVSARTLQYGFRNFRGTTPMNFLREVRLSAARHSFLQGPRCSIAEICFGVGYRNNALFSREYRKIFGESPRETTRLRHQ
ncbi:AraC family transcriptional regulator [Roseiarcaceae bacterium H3SJ34-1]|uniref:AraC family transcriptional regulator n=1 Tax=Terripilifer ovatus TaxID=3032367 RepID=UPI003AB95737|nr:AraC family transcriptional regulator [Roseiarcaceae bacterium H3SJ34-1]